MNSVHERRGKASNEAGNGDARPSPWLAKDCYALIHIDKESDALGNYNLFP